MSSSTEFYLLAEERYPFTFDNETNQKIAQTRRDYVAALRECKTQPAYYAITPVGNLPCSSVPFMPDDTAGWQRVKAHGRSSKKNRAAKQRNLDDYEDF
jgi:hypothetical protein